MNPVLRTLEEWTTHQDYLWFLGVLAWSAVLAAELQQRTRGAQPNGWLLALAGSQIAGAVIELLLLAQDILVPYTRFDGAMGAAQAVGALALVWGATSAVPHTTAWRIAGASLITGWAVARVAFPVSGGAGLALVQIIALLALWRQTPRTLSPWAAGLLIALPMIATHGPWAYAIGHGRRTTDWSHFALAAAATSFAAGALIAVLAWRRQLASVLRDAASDALRRSLRRALLVLVLWLAGGVLLAVWYGRIARRSFEESFLRRVETAVLALDEGLLGRALGPDLVIAGLQLRHYPNGRPVTVATVPHTADPSFVTLRRQLARIRELNTEFRSLYLLVPRAGQMLLLNSTPRQPGDVRQVIHHPVTAEDLERWAAGRSYLEGPISSQSWSALFSAKAPVRDPATGRLLGWLVADVESTRWLSTFMQARLQTMALMAAGVGLWAVAVAYRLRREARDVAERKAAAAAAADRMKSAFLAKVSHELRTPIQSVLGYGELLAEAPLTSQHRAWLAALRSHGDIMLRLVNDLIDLGALQSGAFRLDPSPMALHSLVDDCVAAVRPAAAAKRLSFLHHVSPEVPAWVMADSVRVRQILLNLLNNAVKYTPAGSVSLVVRRNPAGETELIVSDTGPGIPAALRSRLFQPFARLDPAAGQGSGLGLALVQGLCAAMQGRAMLDEGAAAGATFCVTLPLPACEAPPESPPGVAAAPPAAFNGLRVLVGEDNTLVRELLLAFLREKGATVTSAVDGPTALALALERTCDVLLLDIGLPGLDGFAVAERLKAAVHRPRIIGLSAHAGAAEEARARAAGMDDFLTKPVRLSRLARALVAAAPQATPQLADHIADDGLRGRLLAQFASETPGVVADLRDALAAADWPRVQARAHYLKNSADVIGATALQDACREFSRLGNSPDPSRAQRLFDALETAASAAAFISANPIGADRK